ncbi:N-acetyl-alpha-D-glucosaminyl L-malate synthase BshA [soil metagenome]
MKIGIVCYPTYGGSGVVATELGKALADKGHQVHFITYKQPFRLDHFSNNLFYHEVNIADYPLFDYAPYETVLTSKLVDVTKYQGLDLIHVHYAIPHASAAYLAKQILREQGINIPLITTLHGTDITLVGKDATYEPVVTFSINQSDGVTAVSQNLKEETYQYFKIKRDIEVIPNFIDFERFSKTNKEHFRKAIAPDGEKIMIHVSNFRKVKRVRDVVRVYKQVSEKIPAKLLLVGDGPDRSSVEQLCRELDVCNGVRFLGKQEAIEELLAISDVFMIPSGSESFGLAALEAMACEVPVISSNVGGLPEINIHGETGYLSNVGDVDDMAKNTIAILSNPELLEQFRKNAYAQAKKFSLANILPMYESFYERIVEQVKESNLKLKI